MHIGFICSEYPPGRHGGVGSLTQTLARSLVGRGHQVTVIGQYRVARAVEDDDHGVRVVRLAAPAPSRVAAISGGLAMWRHLRTLHAVEPFDVLDGPELSYGALIGRFDAARVIRMHGGHHFFSEAALLAPRRARGRFERRSFARATDLCAVSNFVGETTRRLLSIPASRPIDIIPNPVDTQRFAPRTDVAEDPELVLFVGTLCEKKGVRQLVQAWPEVRASFPDARLVLAGRDSTLDRGSSFAGVLRSAATKGGVEEAIELIGPVPNEELPSHLARAAVCVYPSHMEACPVAWLEGMAGGRAIVASRTGPGPEILTDGETGLLCDPHDPASIADAVCRLMGDQQLRRRLGTAARRAAVERFSVDALLPVNEEFFERCAKVRR